MAMATRLKSSTWHPALLLAGAMRLAGCASDPGPRIGGSGRCSDTNLERAIGQSADEATMRRLLRERGRGAD